MAEAGRLKLRSQMRIELEKEFAAPFDEFVRMIAGRVQAGRLTAAVREQLQPMLAASIAGLVRDRVNDRLTSALTVANPPLPDDGGETVDDPSDPAAIVTSEDEIAGFRIVQAIAARHVDPGRVTIRDSRS